MLWILFAVLIGWFCAAIVTGGVLRAHDEWRYVRPAKACQVCETPRSGLDLLPLVGALRTRARCRRCGASSLKVYLVIEMAIVLLVVFHLWRYSEGVWIPDAAIGTSVLWLWMARDILFTLFLVVIFITDQTSELILDATAIPAAVAALLLNSILGISVWSLIVGMLILFGFFFVQMALSRGRVMGAGDLRMALVMGAMLGASSAIGATLFAYVLGALVGVVLLLTGRKHLTDRVPFGTFLSVATLLFLVWGKELLQLVL